jgi:pre-mRNA-splicing factor SYF1
LAFILILILLFLQTHFILPEYLMQKDQTVNLDEAKDKLKEAGIPEDEMAALERQLAPAADKAVAKERKVGFVSAGLESQSDGEIKTNTNHEEIELPEENDSDEDDGDNIEIAQKDVPSAVFGGLIRKRDELENNEADGGAKEKDNENRLGALERMKKLKRN